MDNEHVLSGLVRKRSEIAGEIERTQARLNALILDLDHIDCSIRLFDPNADVALIKPRQYPPRHQAFRGEMSRFAMDALRRADKPITTFDIAKAVMQGRGLSLDDGPMFQTIRKRVGARLWKYKERGIIREVPLTGEYKGWLLVNSLTLPHEAGHADQ